MGKESYQDLIFSLGDLARERLANKPARPRAMERVFKAEEALVARREELAALEQQMNDEDQAYQDLVAQTDQEKATQMKVVQRHSRAVDTIEGRVKVLRKRLGSLKADLRYAQDSHKKAQAKHQQLEQSAADAGQVTTSRENLKKLKLSLMRQEREAEELEQELNGLLSPPESQPGAAGIWARRRVLELEDELALRKEALDARMAELDAAIAQKDEEIRAAEDFLDQSLFLLGEECYTQRVADPALAVLYPRLDKAK